MNHFTIRICFNKDNIRQSIYQELNEVMRKNEIFNTIVSDQGRIYTLPVGEYNYSGNIDRKMLLEKVKAAAGEMAEKYSVLITESKGRTWYNLATEN